MKGVSTFIGRVTGPVRRLSRSRRSKSRRCSGGAAEPPTIHGTLVEPPMVLGTLEPPFIVGTLEPRIGGRADTRSDAVIAALLEEANLASSPRTGRDERLRGARSPVRGHRAAASHRSANEFGTVNDAAIAAALQAAWQAEATLRVSAVQEPATAIGDTDASQRLEPPRPTVRMRIRPDEESSGTGDSGVGVGEPCESSTGGADLFDGSWLRSLGDGLLGSWFSSPVPEELTCVVCLESEADACLIPCGHVNLCMVCTSKLPQPRRCPICRMEVDSAVKAGRRSLQSESQ